MRDRAGRVSTSYGYFTDSKNNPEAGAVQAAISKPVPRSADRKMRMAAATLRGRGNPRTGQHQRASQ